jgi:hypothetical protein
MPTFHYHARQLLLIAREAVLRARIDADRPNALTADAITAIVLSAASTEAFINEFAEYVPSAFSHLGSEETPAALASCAAVLLELEESHISVTTKYLVGSQVLTGRAFDTGSAPFQDFKQLIELRNSIMHVKTVVRSDRHVGQRVTDALAQRGLAIDGTKPGSLAWFDRLMTPATALWAHDAALEIVMAFLDRVPIREFYDPLDMFRRSFREHPAAQ